MRKQCQISPREVLSHMQDMILELPDKATEEIKEILGLRLNEITKLSFNESPYGPSPMAVEAGCCALAQAHIYQDLENKRLRQALAEFHDVEAEMFVCGNGADEIITVLAQAFLDGGSTAVIPAPTFGQYAAAATLAGARVVRVPVQEDMSISLMAVAAAITPDTRVVFLCNPNNPTGLALDGTELRRFLDCVPAQVLVVLDEAYAEYVSSETYLSGISLLSEYPNVVVVRTFSKIYGLASLRLGYSISHPTIAGFLNKTRNPFNINAAAQAAGAAALRDTAFVQMVAGRNAAERQRLSDGLIKLGFRVYPSQTNFIFADTRRNCRDICAGLIRHGIIIRPGTNWQLPSHVRISLGDHQQNTRLIQVLQELCG